MSGFSLQIERYKNTKKICTTKKYKTKWKNTNIKKYILCQPMDGVRGFSKCWQRGICSRDRVAKCHGSRGYIRVKKWLNVLPPFKCFLRVNYLTFCNSGLGGDWTWEGEPWILSDCRSDQIPCFVTDCWRVCLQRNTFQDKDKYISKFRWGLGDLNTWRPALLQTIVDYVCREVLYFIEFFKICFPIQIGIGSETDTV